MFYESALLCIHVRVCIMYICAPKFPPFRYTENPGLPSSPPLLIMYSLSALSDSRTNSLSVSVYSGLKNREKLNPSGQFLGFLMHSSSALANLLSLKHWKRKIHFAWCIFNFFRYVACKSAFYYCILYHRDLTSHCLENILKSLIFWHFVIANIE